METEGGKKGKKIGPPGIRMVCPSWRPLGRIRFPFSTASGSAQATPLYCHCTTRALLEVLERYPEKETYKGPTLSSGRLDLSHAAKQDNNTKFGIIPLLD